MWVPPELKDPVLRHHPARKSVGYFGAVRLRDGKFLFARELNRFDAMSTWNFLRLLQRRSLKSRRRVIVITDNAKYHHAKLHSAWRQEHQPQFRLDYLPLYSPDLNPIERVWKLTRKLCIHDEYFPSIEAVMGQWHQRPGISPSPCAVRTPRTRRKPKQPNSAIPIISSLDAEGDAAPKQPLETFRTKSSHIFKWLCPKIEWESRPPGLRELAKQVRSITFRARKTPVENLLYM
jgi:DDE superfamily endonuclease